MVYRNRCWSLLLVSFLLFGNSAIGHAAGGISIAQSGNGQYTVQGTELDGVAATEVVVQYDKTALKNPRVEMGGLLYGSSMVTNTNTTTGTVRFATVAAYPQTKSGTGTIATITFDTTGASPGAPKLISGTALDVNGHVIIPEASTPSVASGDLETTHTGGPTTSGGTADSGNSANWLGGSVSMPGEGTTVEAKVRDEVAAPVSEPRKADEAAGKDNVPPTGQAAQPAASAEKSEKKGEPGKSVLDQFRAFQGERTPKALVDLFTRALEGSRQQPPVVLSDGQSSVAVFVDVPSGKTFPHFALKGARLVSLKKSKGTTWVVEAVPAKGTFEATITVVQDGAEREIPLAVAPPLAAGLKIGGEGKLTEADFNRFLSERGTGKAVVFDLNGDGKRDYVDDYIFTANFLAQAGAGKVAAAKQSQKQMR